MPEIDPKKWFNYANSENVSQSHSDKAKDDVISGLSRLLKALEPYSTRNLTDPENIARVVQCLTRVVKVANGEQVQESAYKIKPSDNLITADSSNPAPQERPVPRSRVALKPGG